MNKDWVGLLPMIPTLLTALQTKVCRVGVIGGRGVPSANENKARCGLGSQGMVLVERQVCVCVVRGWGVE